MKLLYTTCGKAVKVDDDDYEKYKEFTLNWCHNAKELHGEFAYQNVV